jgi:ABC-type antimicrobial peptide transport system permease subunit
VTRAVRQAVATALPTTPVEELETYDAAIARLITSDLVIVGVMTGFAVLALLMAAIGLYGVVAYSAGQRRPEFGTRIALGATRRDIVRLVLGHAGRLLAIGLALGMAGGLMAAQAMRATLIGVGPLDPWNVLMVAALLAAVTVSASAIPAMKASRADLLRSLRAE